MPFDVGKDFLNLCVKTSACETQTITEMIDEFDHIKIENYCSSRGHIKRIRQQAAKLGEVITDIGLVSRIYQECL